MYIIYLNIHDGSCKLFEVVNKVKEFVGAFKDISALKDWMKTRRNIILDDNNSEICYTEDR